MSANKPATDPESYTIDDVIEGAAQALRDESESRKWLKALLPYVQLGVLDDLEPGVKTALNRCIAAAADRAARIVRQDLAEGRLGPIE